MSPNIHHSSNVVPVPFHSSSSVAPARTKGDVFLRDFCNEMHRPGCDVFRCLSLYPWIRYDGEHSAAPVYRRSPLFKSGKPPNLQRLLLWAHNEPEFNGFHWAVGYVVCREVGEFKMLPRTGRPFLWLAYGGNWRFKLWLVDGAECSQYNKSRRELLTSQSGN